MSRGVFVADTRLLRRLLVEARPDWPRIVAVFLLGLLATPLALLTPLPLKLAVDSVLGDQPIPGFVDAALPAVATRSDGALLTVTAGLFVLVALLTQAQGVASYVLRTAVGERMVLRFRSRLFDRAQHLSLLHHDRVGTADTTYRIEYDAKSLQYVALDTLVSIFTAGTTLVGMFVVMARIDGALTLVALAITPVLLVASQWSRNRLRDRSRTVKKLESRALAALQEIMTSIRVVKVFGQERREHDRFLRWSSDGMRARIGLAYQEGAYSTTVGTTMAVGSAIVLLVGVRHVQSGILTLGDLLLVMGYLAEFYAPLRTMAKKAGKLQSELASAERAFTLLDEPPEVPEPDEPHPLDRAQGAIEFSSVSFGYETGRPVLHEVSFRLPPGSRVGIAGRTGAGKSTLISLLARFFDPDEGWITLDGVDLRDYRLADLRRQFGVVLQEPVLFSCSIAENIAYARPDATEEDIVEAARYANAHAFISRLPNGYETEVGERGMALSGGERQRIALARAFLKDAPILILDEPTSSVDIDTESSIMEALERLMAGRTTLMISHRLRPLDGCDVVLELESGRIVRIRRSDERPPPGHDTGLAPVSDATIAALAAPSHPAVWAWHLVAPDARPQRVETIKERSKGLRKSAVYRLVGPGWTVIAKCCRHDSAIVEGTIYRDVLPHLGVPFLRWYGDVDGYGPFTWIFVDEAVGDVYRAGREHRVLAGRWLGQLHAAAATHPAAVTLPDRGTGHFLSHLCDARACLEAAIAWPWSPDEAQLVFTTLHTLETVEDRWHLVAETCDLMPRTLVHGDLVCKNLRVVTTGGEPTIVAYDWEKAGYGPPAVDLARVEGFPRFSLSVDLESYRRAATDRGIPVDAATLSRASSAGVVLRCLAALAWTTASLTPDAVKKPLADLAVYQPWLVDAIRDLDRPAPAQAELR